MAPRWFTKQELLCGFQGQCPCCSGNNRVANGERTNQEISTDLPRDHRVPRCQMKQDTMNKVYLPWCQFPPVSGLYELCRTSQVMIWCDLFCVIFLWSSLYKYNVLAFLTLFWRVCSLQISFCIEKKNNQSILWKDSASGKKMWPVRLGATFPISHFLILLHPLLPILDKFFYPESFDSCPTFSQNKQ